MGRAVGWLGEPAEVVVSEELRRVLTSDHGKTGPPWLLGPGVASRRDLLGLHPRSTLYSHMKRLPWRIIARLKLSVVYLQSAETPCGEFDNGQQFAPMRKGRGSE